MSKNDIYKNYIFTFVNVKWIIIHKQIIFMKYNEWVLFIIIYELNMNYKYRKNNTGKVR